MENTNTKFAKRFYAQITEFKSSVEIVLENDQITRVINSSDLEKTKKEVNKFYNSVMDGKVVNFTLPIQLFNDFLKKFANDVMYENDEMFLKEFEDITNKNGSVAFIKCLALIWNKLSESGKKNLWKHIKVLCILSDKTLGSNNFKIN